MPENRPPRRRNQCLEPPNPKELGLVFNLGFSTTGRETTYLRGQLTVGADPFKLGFRDRVVDQPPKPDPKPTTLDPEHSSLPLKVRQRYLSS